MKAEDKLKEAKYFLAKLKKIGRTISADSQWEEGRDVYAIRPHFKYNLSACVQALRSVFDVLLYDYAEKYFQCSPDRQYYMNADKFSKIAERGFPEARRFIKWYNEKFREMKSQHLFYVRITTVHRGGRWMDAEIKDSYTLAKKGKNVYAVPEKEIYIAGMPETVAVTECERIFLLMDEIVKQAREEFN